MKFKEWDTARVYEKSNILQKDERGFGTYFEVPYKEYHMDGTVTVGSEDFAKERLRTLCYYSIHTPTGNFNKSGHMMWDERKTVRVKNVREAKLIALLLYGEQATVRKF